MPGEANPGEADPVVESVEGAIEPQEGNTEPTGQVLRDRPIGRGPQGTDQRTDPSGSVPRHGPTWIRSETSVLRDRVDERALRDHHSETEPFGARTRSGLAGSDQRRGSSDPSQGTIFGAGRGRAPSGANRSPNQRTWTDGIGTARWRRPWEGVQACGSGTGLRVRAADRRKTSRSWKRRGGSGEPMSRYVDRDGAPRGG